MSVGLGKAVLSSALLLVCENYRLDFLLLCLFKAK